MLRGCYYNIITQMLRTCYIHVTLILLHTCYEPPIFITYMLHLINFVIFFRTITCALFLLLLIFTIIDLLKERKVFESDVPQAVRELSLYKNIRNILSLKDNPGSITALHGLRTISTTTIILGHSILIRAMNLHANNTDLPHVSIPIYNNNNNKNKRIIIL